MGRAVARPLAARHLAGRHTVPPALPACGERPQGETLTRLRAAATAARPLVLRYLTSGGALAVAATAQLVTFAILARALGPRQFGLYVQFTAAAAIGVQLCGCGAADVLLRRVARHRRLYPAMLGHSLILTLGSGVLLVALGLPLAHWRLAADGGAGPGYGATVLLLVSNIVLTRLLLMVETIFLGLDRIADANRAVAAFALARTAIAAVACLALSVTTIAGWAAYQFCGLGLYGVACLLWLKPLGRPLWTLQRNEIVPGLLYASQLVVRALRQNIDLFVLGLLLPPAAVGSYGVARRITDASLLTIEAMNRLLYPRFAAASRHGLRSALPDARRALVAALLIAAVTAAALFTGAPLLAAVFGRGYVALPSDLHALSGLIVPVAAWWIAIDLIGASNHQAARATILNAVNLVGSVAIAAASWVSAPAGTVIALYGLEAVTVAAAWGVLLLLIGRERVKPSLPR